jgi:hypothetical protein
MHLLIGKKIYLDQNINKCIKLILIVKISMVICIKIQILHELIYIYLFFIFFIFI